MATGVWRVRMKSLAPGVRHVSARDFAVSNGVVGAGWGLDPASPEIADGCPDGSLYIRLARQAFPADRGMENAYDVFVNRMRPGDYVWIYATHSGEYWCGRVTGEFAYRSTPEFVASDLRVTRPCVWAKAGTAEAVPGVVRRAFAGQFGAVSAMVSDASSAVAAARRALGESQAKSGDLYAEVSPDDLEDICALYLQTKGWLVLPSTAKVSMASYEFVLVNAATGARAGLQVKSGGPSTLTQAVAEAFDRFFVFLSHPNATLIGSDPKLEQISRGELRDFAIKHYALLPQRLRSRWNPNP